jgi:large conductance mechanosensitive channel
VPPTRLVFDSFTFNPATNTMKILQNKPMTTLQKLLHEFREFAMRGNVVDLAVGIIVGTAFNNVVNSLVKDIVMPPIGLALNHVDFSNLYVSLNGKAYDSLAVAQQAGAPTINYGTFINTTISFLITAFVVFMLVRYMNKLRHHDEKKPSPTTKPCPFCLTPVPLKATRCPACTSQIPVEPVPNKA